MSSSFKYGWQNLPDLLFNEVKVMVEIGRLNELYGGPFNQHDELKSADKFVRAGMRWSLR